MTILHLMVGLPCSGKTTWAREIEHQTGAVRFTPDDWQTRLTGTDMNRPDHDRFHSDVEAIMRGLAEKLLARGIDVILDFGFWTRAERDELRKWAHGMGVDAVVHFAWAPPEVLERRRQARAVALPGDGFAFTADDLAGWCARFEPPDADELDSGDRRDAV